MSPGNPYIENLNAPECDEFEERAAIMEYDGKLSRVDAERQASLILEVRGLLEGRPHYESFTDCLVDETEDDYLSNPSNYHSELDRLDSNRDTNPKWVFSGRDLLESPFTEQPCLVDPILQTTGFSLLIGESDIGKTWLALSLLFAVANRDSEWLGYPLRLQYGRAIYIATEDSEENLIGRFHLLQKAFPPKEWPDNITVLVADDKSNKEIIDELHKLLAVGPVDLIVADCFGDLFDGRDANSQADTRKFYKQFAPFAKQCNFMLVHHKGKRTEDKTPSKNHSLGSQAIEAKARTVIDLTEWNGQFYLSVLKCKASREEKMNSKRLEFDENLLVFRDTGDQLLRAQIGLEAGTSIDWVPIFDGKERVKRAELAESFRKISGCSRATGFAKVKKALEAGELQPDNFGNVLNPSHEQNLATDDQVASSPVQIPIELDRLDSEHEVSEHPVTELMVCDLRLFTQVGILYTAREMKARANVKETEFRAALQKALLEGWLAVRGSKYERQTEAAEESQTLSNPSNSLKELDKLDKPKRRKNTKEGKSAKAMKSEPPTKEGLA